MAEPSQEYRLTEWADSEDDLFSHITQLERSHIPYRLIHQKNLGWTIYIYVDYHKNEYNEDLIYPAL